MHTHTHAYNETYPRYTAVHTKTTIRSQAIDSTHKKKKQIENQRN